MSPGEKAEDGEGRNGSYTEVLLAHIKTPDLSIEDLFKRVRNSLNIKTNGKQTSWEHMSLIGEFCFNYGYVSGEYSIKYSKNALVDSRFSIEDNKLGEIIESLKSHNWYVQNPAISKVRKIDLTDFKIDSIFVLGRNIYQAACGKASAAVEYINDLYVELKLLDGEAAFHILNGMLYEIYFSSLGKIRKRLKTECFEKVLRVSDKVMFEESKKFIRYTLLPNEEKVIFLPGNESFIIDLYFENYQDDEKVLSKVFYNGQNVLYDDEDELFDYESSWDIGRKKYEELEVKLSKMLACPISKMQITNHGFNDDEYIHAPHFFKLMNYVN
ncbi:MAG: caspase family protein [Alphaproteobacteria bacterium]|nr:caspase family protein [Alphaproteobacteria bacterium]